MSELQEDKDVPVATAGVMTQARRTRPEEADYGDLKARAARECGSDEVEDVEIVEADFFCVVRHPTAREYFDYIDAAHNKNVDAAPTFALRCILWPSRGSAASALRRRIFLAHKVVDALEALAGTAQPMAAHLIDDKLRPEVLDSLGLDRQLVADFRMRFPDKGALKIVEHELGNFIVRSPTAGERNLWQKAWDAKTRGQAQNDLALSCTLFPDTDALRAVLERFPGLGYCALGDTALSCGGAVDQIRRKKH